MSCDSLAYPLSIDVSISVTLSASPAGIGQDVGALLTYDANLPYYARLAYYTSSSEVLTQYGSNSEMYKASVRYFSQQPHAPTFAVAQLFSENQPATLVGGAIGTVTSFQAINNGAFALDMQGAGISENIEFVNLDFSSALDLIDIAQIVENALNDIDSSVAGGAFTTSTASIETVGGIERIIIQTGTTGSDSDIGYLTTITSPTDISGVNYLNGANGIDAAGDISNFQAVSNGAFKLSINTTTFDIRNIDFSAVNDYDDVASIIQNAIIKYAVWNTVVVSASSPTAPSSFTITLGATAGTISSPENTVSTTDISGVNYLNGVVGNANAYAGYSAGLTFTDEVQACKDASQCTDNQYIYAWFLDNTIKTTQNILDLAEWAEGQELTIAPLNSTDANIPDSAVTNDVASQLAGKNYTRSYISYLDNVDYPEVALSSILQSIDRDIADSATTAKYKTLIGITAINSNSTALLNTLSAKRCNTYRRMLTGSGGVSIYAEGYMPNTIWEIQNRYDLDALASDLQISLWDLFYRSSNSGTKVPFNQIGYNKMNHSISTVCTKYVSNGVLSSLQQSDSTSQTGTTIIPAYVIGKYSQTAQDRTEHKTSVSVTVQLSGSILTANVLVNAQL